MLCFVSFFLWLFLHDSDVLDEVTLAYLVNHINILNNFAENGVVTVEVLCVLAVVADEEL